MDPEMRMEWLAWRRVCRELELLGIDVNTDRGAPVAQAIRVWGAWERQRAAATGRAFTWEELEEEYQKASLKAGREPIQLDPR